MWIKSQFSVWWDCEHIMRVNITRELIRCTGCHLFIHSNTNTHIYPRGSIETDSQQSVVEKRYVLSHRLRRKLTKCPLNLMGNSACMAFLSVPSFNAHRFAHTHTSILTKRIKINWKSMFLIQASTNTQFEFEFEIPMPLILSCIPISVSLFCPFCSAKPFHLQTYIKCQIYNLMILCCSTASPRHFYLAIFKPSNHQFQCIGFNVDIVTMPEGLFLHHWIGTLSR